MFLGWVLVSKNVFEVVHWKHEYTGQEIAQEEEVLHGQLQVDLRLIKPWLQVWLYSTSQALFFQTFQSIAMVTKWPRNPCIGVPWHLKMLLGHYKIREIVKVGETIVTYMHQGFCTMLLLGFMP